MRNLILILLLLPSISLGGKLPGFLESMIGWDSSSSSSETSSSSSSESSSSSSSDSYSYGSSDSSSSSSSDSSSYGSSDSSSSSSSDSSSSSSSESSSSSSSESSSSSSSESSSSSSSDSSSSSSSEISDSSSDSISDESSGGGSGDDSSETGSGGGDNLPPDCRNNEYMCRDMSCIPLKKECDGIWDCKDGSDERHCLKCKHGSFKCKDKTCIPQKYECDGIYDCKDGSDEQHCSMCKADDFICKDKSCIQKKHVCDGIFDCYDGSDEKHCPKCKADAFLCRDKTCIPREKECDGYHDCKDGSDEKHCSVCEADDFICKDKRCIPREFECDGISDCKYGSDELHCCRADEFRCRDDTCIPLIQRCDRNPDCPDSSDERRCVYTTTPYQYSTSDLHELTSAETDSTSPVHGSTPTMHASTSDRGDLPTSTVTESEVDETTALRPETTTVDDSLPSTTSSAAEVDETTTLRPETTTVDDSLSSTTSSEAEVDGTTTPRQVTTTVDDGLLSTTFSAVEGFLDVETLYGWVRGIQTSETKAFLGIPYATPPGRWEYANPPQSWTGRIRDATRVSASCFQPTCGFSEPPGVCLEEMSEDCLYLNVFAPNDTEPGSNKPVMFFIHGGSFQSYSGGADIFNGERMANKGDVVVVTINYRLGALGFLVTGLGGDNATGNYGIADQKLALLWVQQNIYNFGGDPNNVTIFGQSAGAQSVAIHLISQKVDDLFHKAIMQSTPFSIKFRTSAEAIQQAAQFASFLSCSSDDVACMKGKTATEIISAQTQTTVVFDFFNNFQNWGPNIDGDEVPMDILPGLENRHTEKPILMGNTAEEGIGYIYGAFSTPIPGALFNLLLLGISPTYATLMFSLYTPSNWLDARPEISELATDFVFVCPTRKIAKRLMNLTNTWMYIFDHDLGFLNETQYVPYCINNACHSADIPYLFQTPSRANYSLSVEDMNLSDEILTYWTNFAKYGNPNGNQTATGQEWPVYQTSENLPSYVFRTPSSIVEDDYKGSLCNQLDTTNYLARE